ncbi:O-antigen ligase family protein [Bosea sp. BH3]|uniref:O-antigen ligase family protein n=1 Tax=Bosea sp. BH3 TaxID=2871701 RepID=UPI0021CB628D|nr:O-antigen ligase family protein [Bosea sp. BH3]MCU4181157.1 O-antigen ligase family protein [Bosea sp. BH3]
MSDTRLVSIAFFLAFLFGVLAPLFTGGGEAGDNMQAGSGEGNALRQIIYVSLFATILWGIRAHEQLRRLVDIPPELRIVLLYCWLSLAWSIAPGVAVRRLALTTLVILIIGLAVRHLGSLRALLVARYVLLLVLAANFVAVIFFPAIGIHQAGTVVDPGLAGGWRGVFPEKNGTGAACAITVILYVLSPEPMSRKLRIGAALAGLVFLWGTGSKTSLGVMMIALASGWLFRLYRPSYWPVALALLLVAIILAVPFIDYYWDDLLSPLRREDTLTGRAQIWPVIGAYVADHWWVGAGYGSFWNVGDQSPVLLYAKAESWVTKIASAHNGYLDVAAQIGVPGLALMVICLILYPLAKIFSQPNLPRGMGSLLLALLLFCVGHNFTESSILDRDSFVQLIIILTLSLLYNYTAREPQQ